MDFSHHPSNTPLTPSTTPSLRAPTRVGRVVDNVEALMGGPSHGDSSEREEAYHYHSKVMIKEPSVGGAWEWHQDYGYWYSNGCLVPRMVSVLIALNDHTVENGCLRVMPKTHHMGRVTHETTGGQAGADSARLEHIHQRYEDVPVTLSAGDVLFFHCNLFHASTANTSPDPRWSMISCFNARSNDPTHAHHHPCYTPHDRWSDRAIMDLAGVGIEDGDGTVFMDASEDKSSEGEGQ